MPGLHRVDQSVEGRVLRAVRRMNVLQLDIQALLSARNQLHHFVGIHSGLAVGGLVRGEQRLNGHLRCDRLRLKVGLRRAGNRGGADVDQVCRHFGKGFKLGRDHGCGLGRTLRRLGGFTIVDEESFQQLGEVGMEDDDMPVTVALFKGLRRAGRIGVVRRSQFRLIGVVPIAARKPQLLAIAHRHLDVIRRRKHPFMHFGAGADRRPGERKLVVQGLAEVLFCLLIGLIGRRVPLGVVEGQRQGLRSALGG